MRPSLPLKEVNTEDCGVVLNSGGFGDAVAGEFAADAGSMLPLYHTRVPLAMPCFTSFSEMG